MGYCPPKNPPLKGLVGKDSNMEYPLPKSFNWADYNYDPKFLDSEYRRIYLDSMLNSVNDTVLLKSGSIDFPLPLASSGKLAKCSYCGNKVERETVPCPNCGSTDFSDIPKPVVKIDVNEMTLKETEEVIDKISNKAEDKRNKIINPILNILSVFFFLGLGILILLVFGIGIRENIKISKQKQETCQKLFYKETGCNKSDMMEEDLVLGCGLVKECKCNKDGKICGLSGGSK